ncbi:hypothetical protein C8A03DRAFT_13582 [Achaetomium macrosporum]|uniref:Uncharacterized protein n=1 Tax=Achaetomium macrosporum TaxID=79813 RepID=A0AAN7CDJ8_9PEZI|nr:hypothetical protein C8A03DRAFT_13582 [Achaetomium macrosporum]
MCVTSVTVNPYPITTNVGLGQCAGTAAGGAEIHAHGLHRSLVPAAVAAAAAEGGDDPTASFDLLFATGSGDYKPCEDMQMVMQEFMADLERRGSGLHLRED